MEISVVLIRPIITFNLHCYINMLDGLIAILHSENHGVEVGIRIVEHGVCKAHIGSADIRTGCCSIVNSAGEFKVSDRIKRITDTDHGVAMDAVLVAVIVGDIILTINEDDDRVHRRDHHLTICHMEVYRVEVCVQVLEIGGIEVHRGFAGFCAGGDCVT